MANRNTFRRAIVPTLLWLLPIAAAGQTAPDELWKDTFETDTMNWMVMGPGAELARTSDPAHVKNGSGALEFRYVIGRKPDPAKPDPPIGLLIRGMPNSMLANAREIKFWAKSDVDTPLVVVLSEHEGGRYVANIWLSKDYWRHVTIPVEEFHLSDDKNDPKDPDGKLDLDQVEGIGFVSLAAMFALSPDLAKNPLIDAHPGPHALWLDDVAATTEPWPSAAAVPGTVMIDALDWEVPRWIGMGAVTLSRDMNAPMQAADKRALRAEYKQTKGKIVALVRDLHYFVPGSTDRIRFEAASDLPIKLLIALEKRNGARYNTMVDLTGGAVSREITIPFTSFALADDSPADPEGLTLTSLKTLTIADPSGMMGLDGSTNRLWIGPIHATTAH